MGDMNLNLLREKITASGIEYLSTVCLQAMDFSHLLLNQLE